MDLSLSENDPDARVFAFRRTPEYVGEDGVFDIAGASFEWLVTGPHPVCVQGSEIPGLPSGPVPVDELGALLLHKDCTQATRDATWTYLIVRARAEGRTWTVACVGLALPVLVPVAASLTKRLRGDWHEIHAAVLSGFLEALGEIDLDRPAILVRLRWAAYRTGAAALREALDAATPVDDVNDFGSRPPQPPSGHPDLVLATAVRAGVITAAEAALISATRFGELSLIEAAHARGQSYKAAQKARHRAELQLASYLAERGTDNDDDSRGDTAPTPAREAGEHQAGTVVRPLSWRSSTHRVRLRNVTRTSPELAQKFPRPVHPDGPKSGVRGRGTRVPARPAPHRSHGPARRSSTPVRPSQEAPSCD
ncbi:hypothetical protein [Sciscionella marina]|uniref:hypothetical protein n=1 Tax=Sciscionella marina TaxID=508770 RepID=UPI000363D9F6|nr:hypothetical protein [Sciscionella marina]